MFALLLLLLLPPPSRLNCFYGHFPGEPGLGSFIEAKDDGSGVDNWSYKSRKPPVEL